MADKCLGCGNKYDAEGKIAAAISADTCDAITTGGGAHSGIFCGFNPATGKTGLFVAPDAGGFADRHHARVSSTFGGASTDGPLIFNTGNSGNAIYHSTVYNKNNAPSSGAVWTNRSCARIQEVSAQLNIVLNMGITANSVGVFDLQNSTDGVNWTSRVQHVVDNNGLGSRDGTVDLNSEIYAFNGPGASVTHWMRVVVTVSAGAFYVRGTDSSLFIWNAWGGAYL